MVQKLSLMLPAGGGGDATIVADMYGDLLNTTNFVNVTYDEFLSEDLIDNGSSNMLFVAFERKYTFTAGQVLQSIDLYDSGESLIVDKALISVDYTDSGTPTIEASADGGLNWETVTNNTVHDFSNTGTDLRIRFTAGGTGEVRSWAYLYQWQVLPSRNERASEAHQTNYTLVNEDVGITFTNEGATGSFIFDLDAGLNRGSFFRFAKVENFDFTIRANGNEYIADSSLNGTVVNSTSVNYIPTITLQKITDTKWAIMSAFGIWETF